MFALALALITGSLDPSFGTAGRVDVSGIALAVQDDGKIVALGKASVSTDFFLVTGRFGLARLTPAGGIDFASNVTVGSCTFCSSGRAATSALGLQPDGRIVSVGTFDTTSADRHFPCRNATFVAMRHLPDGGLDAGFGDGGVARVIAGQGHAAALQPDGKLVMAGADLNRSCATEGLPEHRLARLTGSGAVDATFGAAGTTDTAVGPGPSWANAVALRPDGKILVAGFSVASGVPHHDFTVGLYDAAGGLEQVASHGFGPGTNDAARALVLQSDGKVLVGGSSGNGFAIMRLTAPATPDASFGGGGKVTGAGGGVVALAVQADGWIVAALDQGDVLRFASDGSRDSGFGIAGRVATGMQGVAAMALQADGRILVGSSTEIARIDPAAPAAITPDRGGLDFGGQSMRTTSWPRVVTFTNASSATQVIHALTTTSGFELTHDCATLAPGAACSATVTFTPAVEGAVAGDLVATGSGGTQKVYLTGTGERSLVTHYYRSILRRDPDTAGKRFWDEQAALLQSRGADINETWFAMANQFFSSREYAEFARRDDDFVADLYATFFSRAPDAAGLAFWTGQLAQGLPREAALAAFEFSAEFTSFVRIMSGAITARAEVGAVMDFYRGLLGRLPDAAGFDFWVQRLRDAQCLGAEAVYEAVEAISSQFARGAEYAARNRSEGQYVGDLYNAFLRRGGELDGVRFWIDALDSRARTREEERRAFIASPEFQGRVNAIVSQGCLR